MNLFFLLATVALADLPPPQQMRTVPTPPPAAAAPAPPLAPVKPSVQCTLDALGRTLGAARPTLNKPPQPAAIASFQDAWDAIVAGRARLDAGDVSGAWRLEKRAHKEARAVLQPVWGRDAEQELAAPLGALLDCLYARIEVTRTPLGQSAVVGISAEHARAVKSYGDARALHQAGNYRLAFLKTEDAFSKLDRAAAKVWTETTAP